MRTQNSECEVESELGGLFGEVGEGCRSQILNNFL